jgi:hypothetical protein
MKQADLFTPTAPVHYGLTATPGQPNRRRVALCGVLFAIAGSDPVVTEVGSSSLVNVTCSRCLELAKGPA